MLPDYEDIRSRIAEPPKWFDRHGVPRYCEPSPKDCSNIYADTVVFYLIRCQSCGEKFVVESVDDSTTRILKPQKSPLLERVRMRTLHYGDPPRHDDCGSGETMNCEDERVIAVWSKRRFSWERLTEFDGYDLEADEDTKEPRNA